MKVAIYYLAAQGKETDEHQKILVGDHYAYIRAEIVEAENLCEALLDAKAPRTRHL